MHPNWKLGVSFLRSSGSETLLSRCRSDTFSGPKEKGPSLDHGLPNLLDGGAETEYFGDICAGDTLSVSTKIVDLSIREGKTTGKMLIVTRETSVVNQDDVLVVSQRSQGIFY